MPQLMPLMWVYSVFVVIMLMILIMDLYYYNDNEIMNYVFDKEMNLNKYMW
uniref:ATP synthase F0 subunit 8 n=1 Tax=Cheliceroides longipalpis TaxID=1560386 RepID=A0A481N018_9ARAC|nr:ATP synthase F0 subunit 8 [Cheliceroides longipalpis]QAU56482.1 ATP synthase F0 subunit 8 [Cheliceroides longipalpis]